MDIMVCHRYVLIVPFTFIHNILQLCVTIFLKQCKIFFYLNPCFHTYLAIKKLHYFICIGMCF